ncbi:MAG: oligoendopeptidase F [Thermoanaerobaculales bacterium]|jgi:oligoendopeptidase F|nr:oligoendopeptidase F [Thermoanaerobaculales bacterium]
MRTTSWILVLALALAGAAGAEETEKLIWDSREDIPEPYRWNIADILADQAAFEAAIAEVEEMLPELAAYSGRLNEGPEALADAMDLYYAIQRTSEDVIVWAAQGQHTDTRVQKATANLGLARSLGAKVGEASAFLAPEIAAIPPEDLTAFMTHERLQPYRHVIDDIIRTKAHIRSAEVEQVLASSSLLQAAPNQIYSSLAFTDIVWPEITGADGETVTASPSLLYSFLNDSDRRVRRDAALAIFGTYDAYGNTFAGTLGGSIKKDVWLARTRGYGSSLEAALDADPVPRIVPDAMVEAVHANLDAIHRYVALRKKVLDLEDYHIYDMYVPVVAEGQSRYTFDEGWTLAMEYWTETLGEEYAAVAERGREERWIDVYTTPGKQGGAYSWGSYNSHPYLFLNWGGTLEDVFTLVHEMGHSIHTYLANEAQPYHLAGYSLFVAEVASVASESLFFEWMMDRASSDDERLALLNHRLNSMTGTFLRQLFFHEFEAAAHAAAERGEPLTKESLGEIWGNLWTTYYGPEVTLDEAYKSGWARIPHFYRTFYVWKYASSFAAGEAIAGRFRAGDTTAVDDYLACLKLGGSVYPMDAIERAGVDLTDPEVIGTVMVRWNEILDEMEKLLLD